MCRPRYVKTTTVRNEFTHRLRIQEKLRWINIMAYLNCIQPCIKWLVSTCQASCCGFSLYINSSLYEHSIYGVVAVNAEWNNNRISRKGFWMRGFKWTCCSFWKRWIHSLFSTITLYNMMLVLVNGLVPNRRQVIIWTNDDPVQWHIYAALGVGELIEKPWISYVVNTTPLIWIDANDRYGRLMCSQTQ